MKYFALVDLLCLTVKYSIKTDTHVHSCYHTSMYCYIIMFCFTRVENVEDDDDSSDKHRAHANVMSELMESLQARQHRMLSSETYVCLSYTVKNM